MKRSLLYTVIPFLAVICVACGSRQSAADPAASSPSPSPGAPASEIDIPADTEPATADTIAGALSDEEKNWMHLTPSQYLEDFDYLYQQMQENYPYFHVAYRKKGVSIENEYTEYRGKIEDCRNDYGFWNNVRDFVMEAQYTGHLEAWGTRYEGQLEGLRTFVEEFPDYEEQLAPYIQRLDNPVSHKNYTAMETFFDQLNQQAEAYNQEHGLLETDNDNGLQEESGSDAYTNVETKILRDGQVAYVKINMFDMDYYNEDKESLFSFYKEISGYPHLIIDITENGGGGMSYYNDLVVAPLTGQTLAVPTYALMKGGENNMEFLGVEQGLKDGYWQPISELPPLPQMNAEDLEEMDYFQREDYTVKPLNPGSGFAGKIWLLVSPMNYSSSEYAAMFAKHSGFATLVGDDTGGDGIGTDPVYIILPNSGLVVQYSPIYGVSADGRGSEEYGTQPDIYAEEGESPLDACLKAIDAQPLSQP